MENAIRDANSWHARLYRWFSEEKLPTDPILYFLGAVISCILFIPTFLFMIPYTVFRYVVDKRNGDKFDLFDEDIDTSMGLSFVFWVAIGIYLLVMVFVLSLFIDLPTGSGLNWKKISYGGAGCVALGMFVTIWIYLNSAVEKKKILWLPRLGKKISQAYRSVAKPIKWKDKYGNDD